MKRLKEIVRAYPKASLIAALIALAIVVFTFISLSGWWRSRSVEKQDAQIQTNINAAAEKAAEHEENANTHRDSRQQAEGRADLANEQREQARANSNLTIEPVRKARQKHEEARKSRPADYPSLSDDELCAELARRGIACR